MVGVGRSDLDDEAFRQRRVRRRGAFRRGCWTSSDSWRGGYAEPRTYEDLAGRAGGAWTATAGTAGNRSVLPGDAARRLSPDRVVWTTTREISLASVDDIRSAARSLGIRGYATAGKGGDL